MVFSLGQGPFVIRQLFHVEVWERRLTWDLCLAHGLRGWGLGFRVGLRFGGRFIVCRTVSDPEACTHLYTKRQILTPSYALVCVMLFCLRSRLRWFGTSLRTSKSASVMSVETDLTATTS